MDKGKSIPKEMLAKRSRSTRADEQQAAVPSRSASGPTPAILRPTHQASAHTLSTTDNILVNYLKTLPPGVDIAQALERLKADLFSIDSNPMQPTVQSEMDEKAGTPVGEVVAQNPRVSDAEMTRMLDDDEYSGATLPLEELKQRERGEEVDQPRKKGQADLPLVEGGGETGSPTQEMDVGSGQGIAPMVDDVNVETEPPSLREEIEQPITEAEQGARPSEMELDPPVQREEEIDEEIENTVVEKETEDEEAPASEKELEIEETPLVEKENVVVLDDEDDEDSVQMPEARVQPTEADRRQKVVEWNLLTTLE